MHTAAEPGQVIAAARAILRAEAPEVPPRFRTFSEIYSATLGPRRFNLTLVGVFVVTALLLAAAGIYGVVAYAVAQRTREIGVRLALGAPRANVLSLILKQGMTLVVIGLGIGLAGAIGLTRLLRSLLYDTDVYDPVTFTLVPIVLAMVSLAACYLPARRAAILDPLVTLRSE
jgi:ABC-type antimicrobial peptide transport system permease subunit